MRSHSFNIVSLAVAVLVVVVAVCIGLVMSDWKNSRGHRRGRDYSSQLRGIHQGLVTFATSNKNRFPGLDAEGSTLDLSVEARYQILIDGDYFTPEYAISPSETDPLIQPWDEKSPVTARNYSYAMLQVPEEGGRRDEWGQTLNSQAIVISDRNTGSVANPTSILTGRNKGWSGQVLWNDNHIGFENSHLFETKYGGGKLNPKDHLFVADGPDDALLIHTGN